MSLKLNITGERDLFDLADALRDAGNKQLSQKLDRGIRKAAKVIEDEVRESSDTYMPRGFEQTFAAALRVNTEVRLAAGRRVTIVFSATGRTEERALAAMEGGRLKHPVYGRYRRLKSGRRMANPWATQRIRPGVITEPATRAAPQAAKEIDKAIGEVVALIEKAG